MTLAVSLAIAACLTMASEEELAFVSNRVTHVEVTRGTPESDAVRFYSNAQRTEFAEFNYDESKAGVAGRDFALEDPLVFADGRKVADKADWAARRRELLALFEREVYGRMPPKPDEMDFELLSEKTTDDRFGLVRRYRQWFKKGHTGPFVDWIAFVPRHAKMPCPVIVSLSYKENDKVLEGSSNHFFIPVGEIMAKGYAFMSAHYTQITGDAADGGGVFNGVYELWGRRDFAKMDNPGSLMVWAWALCRGLDLAEKVPEFDAKRNVVIGYSRLGKAALLAAAFDERFAVCIPNQTGAVGVQLMKRDYGETLEGQRLMFAHWYCRNVWKYAADPRATPFDQHLLLACVAPRTLLLECYHKRWFDPRGEWLSAKAASPVWEFLAGRGLGADDWPEPYSAELVRPPLGYVRRTESHGLAPCDWEWALDFADRALGR